MPFTFTDKLGEAFKTLAGMSLDIIAFNDKASFALPILFTHRGLSGPACLQLSNYWQMGEPIFINLFAQQNMTDFLLKHKKSHSKQLIRTVIHDNFDLPKKIGKYFTKFDFW